MKIFKLMKNNNPENIKKSVELLGISDLSFEDQTIVLDEITKYVFDINQRHSNGEKTFDFELDYKYYFVDFLNFGNGINLNKDEISWWEFDAILEGIFLNKHSILSTVLDYRLYEKPSKNPKVQEEKEHKFRMKMKRKYSLPIKTNVDVGLEKLWNYVEKEVGENKE